MPEAEESWEIELDREEVRVRLWRQKQLERAGVDPFSAFRLAMRFDLDLHRLVDAANNGATGRELTDLYLD